MSAIPALFDAPVPIGLRAAMRARDPATEIIVDGFAGGGGTSEGIRVEIDGRSMVVVDILFRMLRWYEAAAAHGFARDCIPDEVEIDGKVTRLSQDRKMAFVGNSVPPRMAMLLAQANHAHVLQSPGRRAVG